MKIFVLSLAGRFTPCWVTEGRYPVWRLTMEETLLPPVQWIRPARYGTFAPASSSPLSGGCGPWSCDCHVTAVSRGHKDEVLDVAFDSTGQQLVTASADGEYATQHNPFVIIIIVHECVQ